MVVKPSISGHEFDFGDMVWAKMKSQPWWPGHVYNEQFATPLVRQSKREGLLLVAFFGASSYGWFDPSELILFDSNYAEMSLQTDSRAFVRAVKDAIREVNRRIGLSLCCKCRDTLKFKEIDALGFVSVDVVGYDPGAVYSIDVIEKARDSFQPKLTLDFLLQLALEPTVSEHVDIGFIKNKATVMAYRKAVYEDFDQAFGYDPVRTSIQEPATREMSSKAPLSGREIKNKKDDSEEIKEEKEVTSSPLPVPFKDPTIAAGEFTLKDETLSLEKTSPPVFEFSNACVEMSTSIVASSTSSVAELDQAKVRFATAKETCQPEGLQRSDGNDKTELKQVLGDLLSLAVDPYNTANRRSRINVRKAFLRFRSLVFQKHQNFSLQLAGDEPSASKSSEDGVEVPPVKPQGGLKRCPSVRLEEMSAVKRKKVDDIRNLTNEKKVKKKIDEPPAPIRDAMAMKKPGRELLKKTEQRAPEPTMLMMKFPQGGSLPSLSELKTRFACYGPLYNSATQIFRNTFSCWVVFRHKVHAQAAYTSVVGNSSLFGNTGVKCTLKKAGIAGLAVPELPVQVPQEDHHQPAMEDRTPSIIPATSSVHLKPILKVSGGEEAAVNGEKEVVADSLGEVLATAKPKDHANKEYADLSCVLSDLQSLAIDPFNTVNRGSRIKGRKAFLKFRSLAFQKSQNFSPTPAADEPNASKSLEDCVEVPHVKPQGGFKRGPSDHKEEMTAAKRKKVGDFRNINKEKKVTQKLDELPAQDVKKPGLEFIKKTEQQAPEPTMLMIKFPKGGSLPSFKELKARFACYGPMDHSGTHIFWNTFSCQVVFRYKSHAQAAYRFVVDSSSLFGNTGVKCSLKEARIVGSTEPEPPVKVAKEHHNQPDIKDRLLSGVELKSIMKKTCDEEAADSDVRRRVKFMFGGKDSQMKNNMENKTSHLTMDLCKNFQKAVDPSVVTCTPGPLSPPPPTYDGTPFLAQPSLPPQMTPVSKLRVLNRPRNEPPLMTPNTDIAQQMLSLLTRCNDVVMNVSTILGYTPYHPL